MEEAAIAELRPTSHDKIIEARVYRKWIAKTYPQKIETAFCCILIDREGNAIQGNMNVKEFDYFNPKIKVGTIYRISEFICEPTNPYQQTIDNSTSLKFGKITKFDPITDTGFPHHYFNFVSYNQLQFKVLKEDGTGRMQYPILTDYIGCLRSVGELKTKGNDQEDETTYRKLDIENLNDNVVEFTMWDDLARSLEDARIETMEQPVIIAVSYCRVSKRRDYQLTATSATYYYLNPQIPQADESRAQARYQMTPPLRISKSPYEDVEKEKFRNRFPLKTILKQSPESYRGVKFTTEATITSINIKRDWYYISCNECNLKAREENGSYRCVDHGKQPKPCYRYNFKAFITDPSATAPVTFFTPIADYVTGYSCSDLVTNHKGADTQEIPPEIFEIEGQKNIFQIHFNETAKTTYFFVDRVFNKKTVHEATSTEHQTNQDAEPSTLTITNEQDMHQLTAESTSNKAIITQLSLDPPQQAENQATPPTSLSLTNEEDPQQKTHQESRSNTVKRALFQDQPTDPKKQKGSSLPDKIKSQNVVKKKKK